MKAIAGARPAVIFGGPSPEHDISILTGLQVARALSEAGRRPVCIYWARTGEYLAVAAGLEAADFSRGVPPGAEPLQLVAGPGGGFRAEGGRWRPGARRTFEVSAVVVCCHGAPGEDGTLQGALDLAGLPYTGPDAAGAALGMDKLAFGGLVAAAGWPTLPRVAVPVGEPAASGAWRPPFDPPYLVKPRFGGSSIGIAEVADADAALVLARHSVYLRAGAVVEPFCPDFVDLEIAIRTWPALGLSAISRPARRTAAAPIYTYADKYVGGQGMVSAPRDINPELAGDTAERLRAAAREIAELARVRGVARLDFLVPGDRGGLYVNELNTVPGSLTKHLWVDPPLPFLELLDDLLAEAVASPTTRHWTTAGADGSALRSAGTIASKLG